MHQVAMSRFTVFASKGNDDETVMKEANLGNNDAISAGRNDALEKDMTENDDAYFDEGEFSQRENEIIKDYINYQLSKVASDEPEMDTKPLILSEKDMEMIDEYMDM
jgi:hypothetical protein